MENEEVEIEMSMIAGKDHHQLKDQRDYERHSEKNCLLKFLIHTPETPICVQLVLSSMDDS